MTYDTPTGPVEAVEVLPDELPPGALPDGVQDPAEVERAYLPATIDGELRRLRDVAAALAELAEERSRIWDSALQNVARMARAALGR